MNLPARSIVCGLMLMASVALPGCASLSTKREAGLEKVHRVWVEHLLTDNYRTDQNIVEELKRLGFDAACGPLTMMPEGYDAVITYRQRSEWDFKSYLIE